jgi:hypothetical protein
MDFEWPKFLAIALVVGIIGPLFWLGVNSFETWLKGLLNNRKSKQAATTDSRFLK